MNPNIPVNQNLPVNPLKPKSFPIPGHSRMRCDKDFGLIEKLKKKSDKFSYPSDWLKLIRSAKPTNPFEIIYVQNALTDDLADDGTPVVPVFNYKCALDPIIRAADGINQIRGVRIDNTGTAFFVTTTYGTLEKRLVLLRNGISQLDLVRILRIRRLGGLGVLGPAYNSYLDIKPKKLINIKKLLEYVHQPQNKIFYESLDL